MPHVSDVRATSHDRHDPMLVAALAAGDLAGTERDQAIALTATCSECAILHDDLIALARATASAPPPIATLSRDFRLTPADAARLRPGGWRRLVGGLSWPSPARSKPFGVGLATIGLVGLLVGNVQLGIGSSAASPQAPKDSTVSAAPLGAAAPAASSSNDRAAVELGASAAASQAPAFVPAPAASTMPGGSGAPAVAGSQQYGAASASDAALAIRGAGPQASTGDQRALGDQAGGGSPTTVGTADPTPFRPLNILFGGAIVVGIGLLIGSRVRGRRAA